MQNKPTGSRTWTINTPKKKKIIYRLSQRVPFGLVLYKCPENSTTYKKKSKEGCQARTPKPSLTSCISLPLQERESKRLRSDLSATYKKLSPFPSLQKKRQTVIPGPRVENIPSVCAARALHHISFISTVSAQRECTTPSADTCHNLNQLNSNCGKI